MGNLIEILKLIPKELRLKSIFVLCMILMGMIFEMISVSIVLPMMMLVLDKDKILEYSFVQQLITYFNFISIDNIVYLSLILILLVYIIKTIFLSLLSFIQAKFVFELQSNISSKLFTLYMNQRYKFYLERNSAYLIRNITTETQILVESGFLPAVLIINEIVLVVSMIVLLLTIATNNALILLGIVSIGVIVLHFLTKNYLNIWGELRQQNEGLKIQVAQEGLGGIKELKLLGQEKEIISKYKNFLDNVSRVSANRNAIQQFPRIWVEFFGFLAILSILFLNLMMGIDRNTLIPELAFIGMIAFRIMPSANRLLSAIQSINFTMPVITLFKEELMLPSEDEKSVKKIALKFTDKIKISNLCFYYDKNNILINNISLDIHKGKKIGIVGPSGVGKSSFVDLILGFHSPLFGTIEVDGKNINNNLKGWQSMLGYVPQSIFLSDDTLRSNIAFGVPDSKINDSLIMNAIKLAQLDDFVSNLPNGLDTKLGERGVRLSGGQRQRIGIARALYHKPKLLILDEATSALDLHIEKEVMKSIYLLDDSITILIVAHRLTTLDRCDLILQLDNGKFSKYNGV